MRLRASAIPVGTRSQRTTMHTSRTLSGPRHACLGRGSNPTWGPDVNCTRLCNTPTRVTAGLPVPHDDDGGRLWVWMSAPGSCDFDPSWTPCVCVSALFEAAAGSIDGVGTSEPWGLDPGVGASECCLLGGGGTKGAAVCAALTRSISRPPLLLVVPGAWGPRVGVLVRG